MATDDPEEVGPRADSEAVLDGSPSGVATTAARALVVGAGLTTPSLLEGMDDDLAAIGVDRPPKHWGGWSERLEIVRRSDEVLAQHGLLEDVRDQEISARAFLAEARNPPVRPARLELWQDVATGGKPAVAVAWLRSLMTDREPIGAAAAAAALSTWQRRKDVRIPAALEAARDLTDRYAESQVPEARQIARAALSDRDRAEVRVPEWPRGAEDQDPDDSVSLIVHGTAAWASDWWFPGGEFHNYVRSEVRPDLFSGRQTFAWNGAYRGRHRGVAAKRLAGWAEDTVGGPLNTVFAHSFGGVIALHASTYGLCMNEIVLLSAPAENVPVEWRNIGRATSLRIHMDLVLLAARRRQRFTENVEENHLPRWFWHHSDSHEPRVWRAHDCRTMLAL